MNLYEYLENVVDEDKINDLSEDEYELAITRYVLMEISKLFYRDVIFFLNDEDIRKRRSIYSKVMTPNDVNCFEVVCLSYCRLISDILKSKYDIETKLVKTDRDVFKHVILLLITKEKNRYFIDPLMDLSAMKSRMKTSNFAVCKINDNPYVKVKFKNLSSLDFNIIKKIDDKIGYTNSGLYLDDFLTELKKDIGKIEMSINKKEKIFMARKLLNRVVLQEELESFSEFKIKAFLELIKGKININGLVELMIFTKSSLKILLDKEEFDKVKIYDFFVDKKDIKNNSLIQILDDNAERKRGIILQFNDKYVLFSEFSDLYLDLKNEEWGKIQKDNNVFVRKSVRIGLYKYLNELELEPNILDHREFLRIFSMIEKEILNEGMNPKDYVKVINKDKLVVNYNRDLEFYIENDLLTISDNGKKYYVFYNDEGRQVEYKALCKYFDKF